MQDIKKECLSRSIKALYHFTSVMNLHLIFEEEALLSRQALTDRSIRNVVFGDQSRRDNHPDRISVSISHPNTEVLWAQQRHNRNDYAIIRLAPNILWELDCIFFPHNAASTNIEAVQFQNLFQTSNSKSPKSDQAEVMVKDQIPIEFFRKQLIVYSPEARERINENVQPRDYGFSLQVDRRLFMKR